MNRLTLGTTSMPVTPMGIGMAALGRPGYINLGHQEDLNNNYNVDAMKGHAFAVLDTAWENGIRYFDAARSYGKGEDFLAAWLLARNISAEQVAVGSKWGYTYTANWRIDAEHHEIKEHSLPVLEKQSQASKALLGSYLRLYQIHSATLESGVLNNLAVLEKLGRLRDSGLVIGLSLSGPTQSETLRQALTIEIDNKPLFHVVQATWNLLERSAEEALKEANSTGMGIIVKEALANGRLTSRNKDESFYSKYSILDHVAKSQDSTVDALALAAALAQPWVDVVLSGAATQEQLQSNLRALDISWTDELSGQLEQLREPSDEYWTKRSQMAWN